jgi:hypothetical protein
MRNPVSVSSVSIALAVTTAIVGIAACSAPAPGPQPGGPNNSSLLPAPGSSATPPKTNPAIDFTKCLTQTEAAQPKPVYLVFMYDESGSMGYEGKWDAAKAASSAFFASPDSTGVAASLGFFPVFPATDPQNYSCTGADYVLPQLEMTSLPSDAFASAIGKQAPGGATPTYIALAGAISYAQTVQTGLGQDGTTAVVLVTDGLPDSECAGNSIEEVSALAKDAASKGLLTYVIGVGPQLNRLQEIANGGGTTNAFIVNTKNPDQIQHDLLAAMTSIRFQMACDYAIPPPPAGKEFDRTEVNIQYKVDGKTQTFLNSQTCADPNGWRYDNPADPKKILLCGSSCQAVRSKPGEVDVLFGCATQYGAVK